MQRKKSARLLPPVLNLDGRKWKKPRRSNAEGNCAVLSVGPDGTAARDSKRGDDMTLMFRPEAMTTFTQAVKDGAFDRLVA